NRLPFPEALAKARSGIQKLNAAFKRAAESRCRPAETETTTGYHDTITVAFVRVIASRMTPGEDYAMFRDLHPDLFDRALPPLRRHYTKKRLFPAQARAAFVEPDRKELPALGPWVAEMKREPKARTRRRRQQFATVTSA